MWLANEGGKVPIKEPPQKMKKHLKRDPPHLPHKRPQVLRKCPASRALLAVVDSVYG
jgi:hypothetical protein